MKKIHKLLIPLLLVVASIAALAVGFYSHASQSVRYEAEELTCVATDSAGKEGSDSSWDIKTVEGSNISGGKLMSYRAGGLGATVDFTLNVEKGGEYGVIFSYRSHDINYSMVQIYVNGKELGGEISMKTGDTVGNVKNTANTCREIKLGNAEFKEGENTVSVKISQTYGSDSASRTAFTADYFDLTAPMEDSGLVFTKREVDLPVATKENSTPVNAIIPDGMLDSYPGVKETPKTTDKITVWELPECYKASSNFSLKADGVNVPVTTTNNAKGAYDYAQFDYEASKGEIKLEITYLGGGNVTSFVASPQHLDVECKKNGKVLEVTLKINYNYTFKINGKVLNISATPMQTDVPASSGEGIFNITEAPYSVNSSMTDAQTTAAIQKALYDASKYGSTAGNKNGVVYIPKGVYYVGNLNVASNTYVYLEAEAALRITFDKSLLRVDGVKESMSVPNRQPSEPKGLNFTRWISTYYQDLGDGKVKGSYDIRIAGRGTVDARDDAFYNTVRMGNNTIDPMACTNFTLEGLVIRESVCWSIIAARSNNLKFDWLKIYNRVEGMFEGDCIDICESQDAVITNCIGFSRDDPFSTKCWKYGTDISVTWPGYPEYLDNVLFEDCTAYTGCVAFKIGQGLEQSQYNVTFKDCTVLRATIGISVHHKFGRGIAENITFENIYIEDIFGSYDGHSAWCMLFVQHHSSRGDGPMKNILLKNIYIYSKGVGGNDGKKLEIKGQNIGSMVDGVIFNNIYINNKLVNELDDIRPDIETNQFVKNVYLINGELTEDEKNFIFKKDEPNKEPEKDPIKNDEGNENEKDDESKGLGALPLIIAGCAAGVVAAAGAVAAVLVMKKNKKE